MRALREFWEAGHTDAERELRGWFYACEDANWSNFAELRKDFRDADAVGEKVVFNINHNDYRLIAYVSYEYKTVMVKFVGTHAQYSRLKKKDIENL